MAGQMIEPFRSGNGGRGVGAHIAAALLLRHSHADHDGGLVGGRRKTRIVTSRQNERQPVTREVFFLHQHGNGRVGHGQRTAVTRLQLGRQIKPRRSHHMGGGPLRATSGSQMRPDRVIEPFRARDAHQLVVGRMVRDNIQPAAVPVVRLEPRERRIRLSRQFLGFGGTRRQPEGVERAC